MRWLRPCCAVVAIATLAAPPARAGADPFTLETTAPPAPPMPARLLRAPASHIASPALTATVPLWSHSVDDGGTRFTSVMVGTDPFVKQANPVSVVPVYVIPVAVRYPDWGVTNDPSLPDPACSPAGTPLALTLRSPVFSNAVRAVGGTRIGSGQVIDLFQRANFWGQVKPGALNPGYHVVLKPTVLLAAKVTYTVHGGPQPARGGCGSAGVIPYEAWDNYVRTTLIPALPAAVTAQTLPVFLFYNTSEYFNADPAQCCALGYHAAYARDTRMQTYVVSDYERSGRFGAGSGDVANLTHEIAEWMDDPTGLNPTRPWGHLGEVGGCEANLEVGDPLAGTTRTMRVPDLRQPFHVQDLAFAAWFTHQSPSTAIHGWYSYFDTLKAAAEPCK